MIVHTLGDHAKAAQALSATTALRPELSRIAFWLTALFLWSLVLEAPLRYGLSKLHLDALIYLPKLLIFIAVIFFPTLRLRASPATWLLTSIAVIYLAWGMINLVNPLQGAFGFWVLLPLLFGLWAGPLIDLEKLGKLFKLFFLVTILGLLLDPLVIYPWSGKDLILFDRNIEISRQWTSFGVERYAGLSRSSFNTASQLFVFGLMLIVLLERRWLKVLAWLVAGAGIALTTSKGPFGGWLILSTYFAGGAVLQWKKYWLQTWLIFLAITITLMIAIPFSTLWIHYDTNLEGPVLNFVFASFGDRMNWTWPDSLQLLNLDGSYHWWLGRGLGGIGAAQQYFEPSQYQPADNLFVYLVVTFGLPVTLLLLFFFWLKISLTAAHMSSYYMSLFLFLIAYGLIVNVVEEPLLGFILGIALSSGRRKILGAHSARMN